MKYTHHFAKESSEYLKFRPDYPPELVAYLASLVKTHELALDVGTGNGQTAIQLADYFNEVIATDINQPQLDVAIKKENVRYFPWPAEKTELSADSVDLITVSQALHWFDFDKFYAEVRRVGKKGSIIAAWCYSLVKITPIMNRIIEKLYFEILGDKYWPHERKYIDEEYKTIPFAFEKIQTPFFYIEKRMNFLQLMGYLDTWSAVKEYKHRNNNKNPVDLVLSDLETTWGDQETKHLMHWPIHLLVGYIK